MQVKRLLCWRKTIPFDPCRRKRIAALSILLPGFFLAVILSGACASTQAQQPAANPTAIPAAHHDAHPGPPPGFQFHHPEIHPPKGKVPEPGTPVVFDATSLGSPMVLDHNWRLGIAPGSDPAKPDFDDSQWPTRDAKDALAEVANPDEDDNGPPPGGPGQNSADHSHPHHGRPSAWFRLHIQLPAHHGPLVVLVRVPVTRNAQISFTGTIGMDLYVNGKQVVPEGPNGPTQQSYEYQQISRIYALDIPENETNLTLAVRIPFVPFGLDAYTGFFAHRTFFIGSRGDLHSYLELWTHAMFFERLPALQQGLRCRNC